MVARLHHPALVVPDLDKASRFYCDVFGFELVRENGWDASNEFFNQAVALQDSAARFCLLRGHNSYLELFQYSAPVSNEDPKKLAANDQGIRHLCFEVDDVARMRRRLKEAGGILMNEPAMVDGHAICSYCRDPFGNLIELVSTRSKLPDLVELDSLKD